MKSLIVLIASAGVLVGCSDIKKMKTMPDTTKEMNNKMDTTNEQIKNTNSEVKSTNEKMQVTIETMQEMKGLTEKVGQSANHTYLDMRLNESIKDGFLALDAMNKEDSIERKATAAGFYFAAMEFQLWKNFQSDTEEHKLRMFKLSATRFFHDIAEYLPENEMDVVNQIPPKTEQKNPEQNKVKNLYTLALLMHELNPNQELMAKQNGFKPISFLDVINQGLSALADEKAGKTSTVSQPEYVQVIAQNEEKLKTMLHLRYNILTMKALLMVSDIEKKLKAGKMMVSSWQPDFSGLNNSSKMAFATKVTMGAVQTRMMLAKVSYKPTLPTIMVGFGFEDILNNMNPSPMISTSGTPNAQSKQLSDELIRALMALKKR